MQGVAMHGVEAVDVTACVCSSAAVLDSEEQRCLQKPAGELQHGFATIHSAGEKQSRGCPEEQRQRGNGQICHTA